MVVGLCLIAAAIISGDAEVALFLIFPVVSGSGWAFLLGALLIVASFLLWFLTLGIGWHEAGIGPPPTEGKPHFGTGEEHTASYGGVILIGPIPIAFGSDKKIALLMLMAGIVLAVFVLALFFGLAH
jgi:uncharacterized protein (TIGR00304 family)